MLRVLSNLFQLVMVAVLIFAVYKVTSLIPLSGSFVMPGQEGILAYNSAIADINSKHYQAAYPKLEKAFKLAPQNSDIVLGLAQALCGIGKQDEALALLKKSALKDNPQTYQILYRAYLADGKFDEAADALGKYSSVMGAPSSSKEMVKSLHTQAQILKRIKSKSKQLSANDYVVFATDQNGVIRWANHMTIPVYIECDKSLTQDLPQLREVYAKACDEWQEGAGNVVKFKQVKDRKHARLVCKFICDPSEISSGIRQGETLTSSGNNGVTNARMKILTVDRSTRQPITKSELYNATLHEIGHALGIDGHSPYPSDVMFFASVDRDCDAKVALSPRDLQTLKLLYQSEKAYMPPKGSSAEKNAVRIATYNEHIKIYNAAVYAYNAKDYAKALELAQDFLKLEQNNKMVARLIKQCETELNRSKPSAS